ncbi:MAG: SpoIIE family protein phosphatase [Clostridia bacterium]|nr:SpoIIE family protein phosphatase [Clostridia bacterium]
MFQNIAKDFEKAQSQKEDVKLYKFAEIKELAKKFFVKKNILLYIVALMVSMVSFGGNSSLGLAPFGLSILSATLGNGIPIGLVYVITCIGTVVGFGAKGVLNYLITSLVFFVSLFVFRNRVQDDCNERRKVGKNVVISSLLVQILPLIFGTFYVYDLLIGIMQSIVVFIFYKIFVNSITVIREFNYKKVFSIEEIMGASMLIAIALSALTPIHILGFSLKNILCILMVLILGWKNGMLVGATAGITVGVVLGVIDVGNPIMIAAYAISGLLSGLFSRFGRLGVIVGFVLGNTILTVVSNGNVVPIIIFQEILIASLGLLLLPKKVEFIIEDVCNSAKLLPETTERAIEGSKETIRKLTNISETISELAQSYTQTAATVLDDEMTQIEKENKEIFIKELHNNIEGLEDNMLYEELYYQDEIVSDIFKALLINTRITRKQLVEIFSNHNNYILGFDREDVENRDNIEKDISEMIKKINYSYKTSKMNFVYKKKIEENNKNVSAQLRGVSEIIAEMAGDIAESQNCDMGDKFKREKEQIIQLLKQKQIAIEEIHIKKEESGRYKVVIYQKCCDDVDGNDCPFKVIGQVISRVLNETMCLADQVCGLRNNGDVCKFSYMSKDKHSLQIGIAKSTKNGSPVSGDTSIQTRLEDGKYLLALSDGMGSGPEARKSSKIAIKMLERLLTSGFKKDTSIKLINSTLATTMKEEDMYATLDVTIVDLYTENMEFVKNGACPTYVKRNKNVQLLKSISMPTGILDNIDLIVYDKDIEKGDIIVMCTDGIIESNSDYQNKDLWLKYLLEEINVDDVQKIADIIISEAIDNDYGKEKDDMTVIVAKVC